MKRIPAALLFIISVSLMAELPLQGEFWAHRDFAFLPEKVQIWPGLEKYELEPDLNRIYKALLDEARWVYSGMIYGFDFNFYPADNLRHQNSEFSLEPKELLDWGDPRLKAGEIFIQDKLLYCRILYYPDSFQEKWMQSWRNSKAYTGTGAGSAGLLEDGSRKKAMEESIKALIVKYVKLKYREKPMRVSGDAAFIKVPDLSLDAGHIHAVSRCVISISELVKYH